MNDIETAESINRRMAEAEGQGRDIRRLRRDMKMGALAGFLLGACLVIIAFALALSYGSP